MNGVTLAQRHVDRLNIVLCNIFDKTNIALGEVDSTHTVKTLAEARAVLLQNENTLRGLFTPVASPRVDEARKFIEELDDETKDAFWQRYGKVRDLLSDATGDFWTKIKYTVFARPHGVEVLGMSLQGEWDGISCPQLKLSTEPLGTSNARIMIWQPYERDTQKQEINLKEAMGEHGAYSHSFPLKQKKQYSVICYDRYGAHGRNIVLETGRLYPAISPWTLERT